MRSLAARAIASEQMDAADLDSTTYAKVLADLAQVNSLTLARWPTLRFLDRVTHGLTRLRLLDVGFGQGDMLRSIARWAARRGIEAELTGIDLNPNSAPAARAATPREMRIAYRTGDYQALDGSFDVVVSSLVAHHMTSEELIAFLRWMEATADRGWLLSDLHRLSLPHWGFPLLARAMRWHRIVREDGTLSIARSFRPSEWHALLAEAGVQAQVKRRFPFRLCVERIR